MSVIPVARQLFLCEHYVRYENAKYDLYSIFNSVTRGLNSSVELSPFYVFAQLANGQGRMSFRIAIRSAEDDRLIFASDLRPFTFSDRLAIVPLVFRMAGFKFSSSGVYLFELYCDNIWICDTPLVVLEH
jgi:hypothetical protein